MLIISLFVPTVVYYNVCIHSCSYIHSVVQDSW